MIFKKRGFQISPVIYSDMSPVDYQIVEISTGRVIEDGIPTMDDAKECLDEYLNEMDAFNDGPFSHAQCAR